MELRIITPEEAFLKAVEFNHEEIKQELALRLEKYKGLVYSEEQIKEAKTDRATLNKFKTALEDRRKEIKNKCLEPYELFEKRIKEITGLVDAPILEIDGQVKGYEEKQKQEKKEMIEQLYSEMIGDMKDILPLARLWNEKWTNATYKFQEINKEMTFTIDKTRNDLISITSLESEFELQIKDTYLKTLDFGEAIREKSRLEERKAKLEAYEKEQKAKQATKVEVADEITLAGTLIQIPLNECVQESIPEHQRVVEAKFIQELELEALDFRVWVTAEQKTALRDFLVSQNIKFGRVTA